jgi:RNA polymerase sigma factor (sigma-70 family)
MSKFSITITAKARHGKLWELRKKFGTTRALAKYLEMGNSELGDWLNLKKIPALDRMHEDRRIRLEERLGKHGIFLEDLFPDQLKDILDKPKDFEITREISLNLLAEAGGIKLLNSPIDEVIQSELKQNIIESIMTLTPREKKVIILHFGLDGEDEHNHQQIANILEITHSRVQQIEAKVLRKLRNKSCSKKLRDYIELL